MAKKKPFEIHDSFELKLSKSKIGEIRDSVDSKKALIVKIRATHGGYVNGNKYYYNIESMEDAADSWTKPFNKPILTHHDEKSDPIGRVIDSEFIPLKTNDKKKPKGNILLTMKVTDKDAIDKILDGRYMTVSVGSRPKNAYCSICDNNIAKNGLCEHRRGNTYNDELCYWSIDVKEYTEVSFINKPADVYQNGIDSAEYVDNVDDNVDNNIDMNKAEFYLEDMDDGDFVDIKNFDEDKVDGTWTRDDLMMVDWLIEQMNNDPDLEDNKLTTTARRRLSKNVFCAPDKKFPVNDCAHYKAALSYIGRYKGNGDIGKIRACIERRGKILKCPSAINNNTKKTKDEQEETSMDKDIVLKYEDEISALKKELEDLKVSNKNILTEKEDLEKQLSDKAKDTERLNDELIAYKTEKHMTLVDELFSLRKDLEKSDVKDISDEDVKSYKDNLAKRTDDSITDSIKDLKYEIESTKDNKKPGQMVNKDSVDKDENNVEKHEDEGDGEADIRDLSDFIKNK